MYARRARVLGYTVRGSVLSQASAGPSGQSDFTEHDNDNDNDNDNDSDNGN